VAANISTRITPNWWRDLRNALAVIPRLAALYDEPFADSSQIPTTLLSQPDAATRKMSLSGDGGMNSLPGYELST